MAPTIARALPTAASIVREYGAGVAVGAGGVGVDAGGGAGRSHHTLTSRSLMRVGEVPPDKLVRPPTPRTRGLGVARMAAVVAASYCWAYSRLPTCDRC